MTPDIEKKHDCHKGCFSCCMIRAHVSDFEKDAVLKALREMPNQHIALQRAEHRSNMGFTLAGGLAPCVALGPDGACQIYESRPETCRTYSSTDKRECEKGVRGLKWDKSVIDKSGRTPSSYLAYIDELYLAQARGDSTEIKDMAVGKAKNAGDLYVIEGDVAVINPIVKHIVDRMPKELGSAMIMNMEQTQFISVTCYSKQIQIEEF